MAPISHSLGLLSLAFLFFFQIPFALATPPYTPYQPPASTIISTTTVTTTTFFNNTIGTVAPMIAPFEKTGKCRSKETLPADLGSCQLTPCALSFLGRLDNKVQEQPCPHQLRNFCCDIFPTWTTDKRMFERYGEAIKKNADDLKTSINQHGIFWSCEGPTWEDTYRNIQKVCTCAFSAAWTTKTESRLLESSDGQIFKKVPDVCQNAFNTADKGRGDYGKFRIEYPF